MLCRAGGCFKKNPEAGKKKQTQDLECFNVFNLQSVICFIILLVPRGICDYFRTALFFTVCFQPGEAGI
jgi:hypothetical protein